MSGSNLKKYPGVGHVPVSVNGRIIALFSAVLMCFASIHNAAHDYSHVQFVHENKDAEPDRYAGLDEHQDHAHLADGHSDHRQFWRPPLGDGRGDHGTADPKDDHHDNVSPFNHRFSQHRRDSENRSIGAHSTIEDEDHHDHDSGCLAFHVVAETPADAADFFAGDLAPSVLFADVVSSRARSPKIALAPGNRLPRGPPFSSSRV